LDCGVIEALGIGHPALVSIGQQMPNAPYVRGLDKTNIFGMQKKFTIVRGRKN
jgi:hypothetical protein